MDWTTYVRQVVGNDKQVEVAQKTGIDQTTISRWLAGGGGSARISSQSVAKFARGYGLPVLQAFVMAGFLTPEEAGMKTSEPPNLGEVDSSELLRELQRRLPAG